MAALSRLAAVAALAALLAPAGPAAAAAAGSARHGKAPAIGAPVILADARRFDIISSVNHHHYAISIAFPSTPPPRGGYAVLYVLDGYDYFASAVEAVRASPKVPGVVVVGVGYPETKAFLTGVLARHQPLAPWFEGAPKATVAVSLERLFDLTLPVSPEVLSAEATPGAPPPKGADIGGLDGFLQTLERDVKPRVEALTPIDRSNQAIFGHSLGGLAVLHALFTEPQAFRTYVAASPSIWWGGRSVLRDEAAFAKRVEHGAIEPRVLVTVGAQEEDFDAAAPRYGLDPQAIEAQIHRQRMIGNARDLVARLQALHGAANYRVEDLAAFTGVGHVLSPWPALGRAIAFAFPAP